MDALLAQSGAWFWIAVIALFFSLLAGVIQVNLFQFLAERRKANHEHQREVLRLRVEALHAEASQYVDPPTPVVDLEKR